MPRFRPIPPATRWIFAAAASALAFAGVARLAASPPPPGAAPAKPAATATAGPADKTIAELRAFEDKFNKAYEANELKAYFECYSDDMTQFYQQGRLDLPEYRKLWEKEIADGGRMVEVKTADMVFHVAPSNDAAAVAYRIFTRQRHADGTVSESWNQETDVLFRTHGQWKVVHVHYSDAPKAG